MVEKPFYVKQLSLNHVCKKGLKEEYAQRLTDHIKPKTSNRSCIDDEWLQREEFSENCLNTRHSCVLGSLSWKHFFSIKFQHCVSAAAGSGGALSKMFVL
jgi:hypothetical protein